MKGKRVVFTSPGSVEIETFDVPRPGTLEVLVETEVSLISPGTEGASLMGLPTRATNFRSLQVTVTSAESWKSDERLKASSRETDSPLTALTPATW